MFFKMLGLQSGPVVSIEISLLSVASLNSSHLNKFHQSFKYDTIFYSIVYYTNVTRLLSYMIQCYVTGSYHMEVCRHTWLHAPKGKINGFSSDTPLICIIIILCLPMLSTIVLFQYFNSGFNFGSDVAPRVGSSFTPTDYCPFASPLSVSYAQ